MRVGMMIVSVIMEVLGTLGPVAGSEAKVTVDAWLLLTPRYYTTGSWDSWECQARSIGELTQLGKSLKLIWKPSIF